MWVAPEFHIGTPGRVGEGKGRGGGGGRTVTKTRISRTYGLPYFLTNGAMKRAILFSNSVVCEYCCYPQAILFMSLASGKSSLRVSPLNKRSRTVIEAIETFTEVSPYVFIFICSPSIFSPLKVTYE